MGRDHYVFYKTEQIEEPGYVNQRQNGSLCQYLEYQRIVQPGTARDKYDNTTWCEAGTSKVSFSKESNAEIKYEDTDIIGKIDTFFQKQARKILIDSFIT